MPLQKNARDSVEPTTTTDSKSLPWSLLSLRPASPAKSWRPVAINRADQLEQLAALARRGHWYDALRRLPACPGCVRASAVATRLPPLAPPLTPLSPRTGTPLLLPRDKRAVTTHTTVTTTIQTTIHTTSTTHTTMTTTLHLSSSSSPTQIPTTQQTASGKSSSNPAGTTPAPSGTGAGSSNGSGSGSGSRAASTASAGSLSASGAGSSSSALSAPQNTAGANTGTKRPSHTAAIVGGVVGGVIALLAAALLLLRRRQAGAPDTGTEKGMQPLPIYNKFMAQARAWGAAAPAGAGASASAAALHGYQGSGISHGPASSVSAEHDYGYDPYAEVAG
ncbi:hypothetical protein C8R47DRAFT_1082349 [Mycena vitilis]|nr:hypothetical protein C8R47DRAFT_1082349 [Mycena vitilis]